DELTCLDHRTLLDGDLDDRALHGGGEGAVARGRAPGLGRAAAGGTTPRPAAAAARPDAQAGREDDLEPLAADLDDDALGRLLRAVRGGGRRDVRCGEPGEALGELRLDPRRVDGEGGGVLGGELGRLEDGAGEGDHRGDPDREEHTSELQSREKLVCRLLLEKKNTAVTQSRPAPNT